jgi:hypothetical protein
VVAHPLDIVYFDIFAVDAKNYEMCMNIHPSVLQKLDWNEKKFLYTVKTNDVICNQNYKSAQFLENDVKICHTVQCPLENEHQSSDRRIDFEFLAGLDPLFTIIGKYRDSTSENVFTVKQSQRSYSFVSQRQNFFILGVEHIGATPHAWIDEENNFRIADGIDHILFVLVLMLVSLNLRSLLINVTGFTLGHSLSLGLSLAQIIRIPALYIEPAIAASIMVVALVALFKTNYTKSFFVTVLFGLLHGLGFSYVLDGLQTNSVSEFLKTLFFFNMGIEVGQLIILVLLMPLYWYVTKWNKHSLVIKKVISGIIFLLALYWTVQRTVNIFA